jgi:hypothetical protein
LDADQFAGGARPAVGSGPAFERPPVRILRVFRRLLPIRLQLDRRKPGSVEHFWHFLLGVALPLLDFHRRTPRRLRGARLLLESCGPAMDPVLPPICRDLGLDLRIQPRPAPSPMLDETAVRLDRAAGRLTRRPGWMASRTAGRLYLRRWDHSLARGAADDPDFVDALRKTAASVVELAANHGCCLDATPDGAYLLLQRSPQPDYFAPGGAAEIPTYGTGRRSIEGLDAFRDILTSQGIPAVLYEPGAHGLLCQARHFSRARGAIGIRGAEFGNLVWMRPDSIVIMPCWPSPHPPPQRALARAIGLRSLVEQELAPSSPERLDIEGTLRTLRELDRQPH